MQPARPSLATPQAAKTMLSNSSQTVSVCSMLFFRLPGVRSSSVLAIKLINFVRDDELPKPTDAPWSRGAPDAPQRREPAKPRELRQEAQPPLHYIQPEARPRSRQAVHSDSTTQKRWWIRGRARRRRRVQLRCLPHNLVQAAASSRRGGNRVLLCPHQLPTSTKVEELLSKGE